jgi:hypothetical protein
LIRLSAVLKSCVAFSAPQRRANTTSNNQRSRGMPSRSQ